MLQLFQSIFGSGRTEPSAHPADLVERAIDRAVEATDSRLRAVPGYEKKLRGAVSHALDHVVALVDDLPAVLEVDPRAFGTNREVTVFFTSVDHVREVLERDPTLNQWRSSAEGAGAEEVNMLLLMTLQERKALGVALEGDVLRHDVAQTTVSLSKHRLVDMASVEAETRRLLKRRAFDHLLSLALGRMAATLAERGELERERDLLRRKQAALTAAGWSFDAAGSERPADPRVLRIKLEAIESQLGFLGTGSGLLKAQLGILVEVLAQAEQQFWSVREPLIIDRMGVKQVQASELAPEVELTVLHNAAGQSLVARVVRVGRGALPPQRDLMREAERYLI
jgi:hypothetical protein